jgi:hypothetical protein
MGGGGCGRLGTSKVKERVMTKTKRKYPKPGREMWWWTYSERLKRCQQCREGIEPETTFAYLPLTRSVLCQDCFEDSGNKARVSERLRVLRGGSPWTPSADEGKLLSALADGPLTHWELSEATRMPMGKVRGLLGHLKARKRVVRDDDQWKLT